MCLCVGVWFVWFVCCVCVCLLDLILSILSEQPKDLERILTNQIRALPEELTLRWVYELCVVVFVDV